MDINNLKTVSNFGREFGYSAVHIYRLINDGTLRGVVIDGVKFVDVSKLPKDFKKK